MKRADTENWKHDFLMLNIEYIKETQCLKELYSLKDFYSDKCASQGFEMDNNSIFFYQCFVETNKLIHETKESLDDIWRIISTFTGEKASTW